MSEALLDQAEITLDDLMQLGSDARVEVRNGVIVEMPPVGGRHHFIVAKITYILESYVNAHPIGVVFPDGLIYLMHSESKGLKDSFVPDVSFIHKDNLITDWEIDLPYPGSPDLAVEVLSPGETGDDILEKVRTYLAKGTQQIWVVYPKNEEVHQYRQSDPATVHSYRGQQTINTDDLFPDLELQVDIIFQLPDWVRG